MGVRKFAMIVRDGLGLETAICYNAFNMVGSVTDSNGIATEYTYSPARLVTRIVRRDGADVMTSLEVMGASGEI